MSEQTNLINVVNDEQYVDWPSLRYYDQRIKDYIRTTSATKEDQEQLRHDLEQLEKLLSTFAETFTADKNHILKHIEECKESSATKTELAAALEAIREEIKAISGVDLSAYATKEFVEEKIAEVDIELPEGLVTEDALQEYVAEEIAKIEHPTIDLSGLATKEALAAVEAKIPSVEGLASEEFVIKKIAEAELADQDVDLSAYYTKSETDSAIKSAVDAIEVPDVSNLATKEELDAVQNVAGENSVKLFQIDSDLVDINAKLDTIPTKVSELENDAGYVTVKNVMETVAESKLIYTLSLQSNKQDNTFIITDSGFNEFQKNWAYNILKIRVGNYVYPCKISYFAYEHYKVTYLECDSGSASGITPVTLDIKRQSDGYWKVYVWRSAHTLANTATVDAAIESLELRLPTKVSEFINDTGYITLEDIPETDLSNYYNKTETENLIAEAVESIEHPTVDLEGYATEEWVNEQGFLTEHQDLSEYAKKSDIPEAELFVVDFNTPDFAAALEAHNKGKLLLLANAAPDSNGYAVMNYVRADLITFTKFLTSRSEAYGSFNTYYLHSDNTWEISKEVKLNKVEANVDGEVNGELTSVRIGKEVYSIPSTEGFASIEYVNNTSENLQTSITSITETTETLQTTVTQVQENVTQVSTQVTELEQNIQNNYITIENGVTKENLEAAVKTQVETEIEVIVDEKIAEVVEQGVTVSSIAYGEF